MLFWVQIEVWLYGAMFWCGVETGSQGHFGWRCPVLLDQGHGLAGAPIKRTAQIWAANVWWVLWLLSNRRLCLTQVTKTQPCRLWGSFCFKAEVKGKGWGQSAAEESRIPWQKSSEAAAKTMESQTIPPCRNCSAQKPDWGNLPMDELRICVHLLALSPSLCWETPKRSSWLPLSEGNSPWLPLIPNCPHRGRRMEKRGEHLGEESMEMRKRKENMSHK